MLSIHSGVVWKALSGILYKHMMYTSQWNIDVHDQYLLLSYTYI